MASVLERFWPGYEKAHGSSMPPAHRKAAKALMACRTPAMGGHLVRCQKCEVVEFNYHSCRHRACPKCSGSANHDWLEARRDEILPVRYFHIVFTVPEELRKLIRRHQRLAYPVLLDAVGSTLRDVAADSRNWGGTIGAMMVLHTWSRTLTYHPHVHCLVPSGYLDADKEWHEVRRGWFASRKVLATVFRAKLLAGLRAAVSGLQIPGPVCHKRWVVHVDRPRHGTDVVLKYLARYVHRVALSDHRILAITDTHVTFKYKDAQRKNWRVMTVSGRNFIYLFMQHVLPKHLHKVRYFGFWSRSQRPLLRALRQKLLEKAAKKSAPKPPAEQPTNENVTPFYLKCPHCEGGVREVLGRYNPAMVKMMLQHDPTLKTWSRPPPDYAVAA